MDLPLACAHLKGHAGDHRAVLHRQNGWWSWDTWGMGVEVLGPLHFHLLLSLVFFSAESKDAT